MIEINLKIDDTDKSPISSFAYNIGKIIEEINIQQNGNLELENAKLTAKILGFRGYLSGEVQKAYEEFFDIKVKRSSRII